MLLALVGATAFVMPDSASATTGHAFAGQFGEKGSGDGQFASFLGNGPVGVAVMPSTGEVFTVDNGVGSGERVQRFDAAGVFQSAFALDPSFQGGASGLAVDPTGFGAVYVATGENGGTPSVVKYSLAGVQAYALDTSGSGTTINGNARVAVDPADGTVYVTATRELDGVPVIASFDQTGVFIGSFDGSDGSPDGGFAQFCYPSSLAVDSSHRVYALDPCKGRIDQYSAAGTWAATIASAAPSAVAVDPASDEVYVAQPGLVGLQIAHLTPGGTAPIYTFDASTVNGVRSMAVSGIGTVYTSDATDPVVERFVRFDGPTLTTDPADPVNARDATLNGTIDPEGVDSTYHFEYGLDEKYGSSTEESGSVGSGSDPVAASGLATGLQPSKTYHFRIVGSNASGSIQGPDLTFTTGAAPPTLDGEAPFASAIGPRSARAHGSVNPNNNGFTIWRIEYGTTTDYGSTTQIGFAGGGSDVPVVSQLSNLQPGTLYHFRVVAESFGAPEAAGLQVGADQTFITSPAAGGGATDVTTKRATLTGTVNPHGENTTYHFNYGPTIAYGASTPEIDAGDGDGDQVVTDSIEGLKPDTTYHVQVVATSDNGVIRYGGDGLFRTAPAPDAVAISPIGVTTSTATLVGDLDTHGLAGTYRFDVSSLDSSYSSSTAERPAAGNDGTERVTVAVDGLPAGETFVVALRVTSNDSTDISDQVTFATASVPKVFPPPPSGDGASSYGCKTPRLESYNARPKPGDTITVSGQDLGAGGTVVLGDRSLLPDDWSTTGFKLEIPDDATGTLGLTVNCGQRSNTVAIAIYKKPSNRFSIANTTVNGSKATLSIRVAGPGKLTSTASKAKPGKATIRKARGAKLVVKLNQAGVRALRESKTGRLKVPIRVRYQPAGGRAATKTVTVTFKHTAGR